MTSEIEAFGRKWKRVWVEDDATRNDPTAEHLRQAWKRLFREEYPGSKEAPEEDHGDTFYYLFSDYPNRSQDRMYVLACDGDSIYVPADAAPVRAFVDPGTGGALVYEPPETDPYTAMAREFLAKMGKTVRDAPSLGTPEEREERVARMLEELLEELLEVAEALKVEVFSESGDEIRRVRDLRLVIGYTEPDAACALRELADLQVTVSGTAAMFGLPLLAATREIHRANMEKTPSGPSGKPTKPEGWKPPDVSGLVAPGDRSVCLASDECGVLCQDRCTVKESARLGTRAVTFSRGAGEVRRHDSGRVSGPVHPVSASSVSERRSCDRAYVEESDMPTSQLVGADPSQPSLVVLAGSHACDPVCLRGVDCDCACHGGEAVKHFVFLDFETTGLDEQVCAPIEVAVVVTDERLVELGFCESLIIPVPGCAWDPSALEMHERSGLAGEASRYGIGAGIVEDWLRERLTELRGSDTTLHLAGNSVHFDRRFLRRYFPGVERLSHHRHLDVSSVWMLAEAAGRVRPEGEKLHRAMADVRRSLEDARRFLGVFRCP